MFKFYRIKMVCGDFKVVSISRNIALLKAYKQYKRNRINTTFLKFKSIIIDVFVNE